MTKHDGEKPMMSLVPQIALRFVAEVMTFGAKKYGKLNWKQPTDDPESDIRRLKDAALRHINADLCGEEYDPETNLSHLSHAASSIMMALERTEDLKRAENRA